MSFNWKSPGCYIVILLLLVLWVQPGIAQEAQTPNVIGISHSAEYLWWGQLKPHSIKQRLLLTAVKGSRNPAESEILWALKGFCSSTAERMPYKRVIRFRLPAEPPEVECV